ncbi:MAG: hypothetical protein R3298_08020 [Gammaproteobacteria bacterium]|nr:hypothetical protein [Gammaproteobacteria bacterium]
MRPEGVTRGLVVLALAALLAACGFQLRGTGEGAWPATLARIHLGGPALEPQLERRLAPALERAGAELVAERDRATARLEIVAFDEGEDLLALGVGSTVRDLQITVRIDYTLDTGDASGPRRGSVASSRTVRSRADEIAATLAEARRARRELREESIDALVRRLAASG